MANELELLTARIRRNPPRSQEAGVRLAVRHSIATLGPVAVPEIPAAALGIAKGLFGPAYDAADKHQQFQWRRMAIVAYRAALLDAKSVADLRSMWDMCDGSNEVDGFDCEDLHAALNRKGDGEYCAV